MKGILDVLEAHFGVSLVDDVIDILEDLFLTINKDEYIDSVTGEYKLLFTHGTVRIKKAELEVTVKEMVMNDIKEYNSGVEKLIIWADAYYNKDNPLATDKEYDKLARECLEFEKNNPNLVNPNSPNLKVGGVTDKMFTSSPHLSKMWSQKDIFNYEELTRWCSSVMPEGVDVLDLSKSPEFYVQVKLDGLSLNLIYDKGKLVRAMTRGDGVDGEIVTENALVVKGVLPTIDYDGLIEIRGEVLMPFKQFNTLNDRYRESGQPLLSNPRNAAAGSLRQLDTEMTKSRGLVFISWGLGLNSLNNPTFNKDMEFIESLGFEKSLAYTCKNCAELFNSIQDIEELRVKGLLAVQLDGAVVKINDKSRHDELGYTSKFPKWSCAFKYPAEEKTTKVLSITQQVGRTGVVTPVAELEPVVIDGVTISRVTLHNYNEIYKLGLMVNDNVIIIRSGDVIPKLIKVLSDRRDGTEIHIMLPTKCPTCDSELTILHPIVKCDNLLCSDRVVNSIIHYASRECMNIKGLGDKTVEMLVNNNIIRSIPDIYNLSRSKLEILDNFGDKKITALLNAIDESKGADLDRLIHGLGIDGVGASASTAIMNKLGLSLLDSDITNLTDIPGFGPALLSSTGKFIENNRELIKNLLDIVKPTIPIVEIVDSPFTNKVVVITGTFKINRNELKSDLERMGAIVNNSVSKKTDYLIYGENSGSKYDTAVELGVKTINEEEYNKIINKEM